MIGTLFRLMPYAGRQWPWLVVICVLTVLSSLAMVLQPWPLKILVDYALADEPLPSSLATFLEWFGITSAAKGLIVLAALASLALFALNSVLNVILSWAWTSAGQRMVYDLAADVFAKLQRLPLSFHHRRSVGDSLDRLSTDTYCIYSLLEGVLVTPAFQVLTLVGIGVAAWSLDPLLTMISLATAPVLAGVACFFGPRLKRRAQAGREAQAQLLSFVHQTLSAVPVAQAFNTEKQNVLHYSRLADQAVSTTQKGAMLQSLAGVVAGLTKILGMAVILVLGGQRVLSGNLSVGSLLVFIAYLRAMQVAFDKLFQTHGKLKFAEASVARVLEILDAEELADIRERSSIPAPSNDRRGQIVFEHVSFGYEPDRLVLKDISLELKSGETVAIVGPTGAGKSTLISLISRLYDVSSGRVTVSGLDVRDFPLARLRGELAVVLQDPYLLPLTIAENIALGRAEASREEIQAAAQAANADEFIQRLPEGYDTVIGEEGATLSGGEKQRLAIARAMLKHAPIIILDEPSSALDANTESAVLEALARLIEGRTTLIIAHRLSTIQRADRIVVLEEGRIVESGTPKELLGQEGAFQRLKAFQRSPLAGETAS